MPAKVTTAIEVNAAQLADTWEVVEITINNRGMDVPDGVDADGNPKTKRVPFIRVTYKEVFGTDERTKEVMVDATAYAVLKPTGTKTWYDNLKSMSYQILKDRNKIPTDAVVT